MSRRASYEIVVDAPDYVVIRDVGMHDRQLSVTNDAEWVVDQVERKLVGLRKRLFYYDSAGELDELLVEWREHKAPYGNYLKGFFAGFKRCPARNHSELRMMLATEVESD